MKYRSYTQNVFNCGKIMLFGAIATVPATFIASRIKYENKEETLLSKQKELGSRLSHNKMETPIVGCDQQGDVIVTQGNTQQMLTQTSQDLTALQEQGSKITNHEIIDGLWAGAFVAQLAAMGVRRAWRKTATRIGEAFADRKAPLPEHHVAIPNFE